MITKEQSTMRIQVLSTSAAFAVAAFLAYPNDALALTDLVVTVDCASGGRINQALSRPTLFDRRLVIVVQGTCSENVTIERDDVMLRDGAVSGPDLSKPTILINGARRVVLEGLDISGGINGVYVTGGAAATIRSSTVSNAARNGVLIDGSSSALIDGSTIKENGTSGVAAVGARVTITSSAVKSNQLYGVAALGPSLANLGSADSTGNVCCGNTIENNTLDGVIVADGAAATLWGNTIQGNHRYGALVVRESSIVLRGGNVVSGNGTVGGSGGGAYIRGSTLNTGAGDTPTIPSTNAISDNNRWGIIAEHNASLDLRGGLSVTGNPLGGVLLSHGTRLRTQDSNFSNNGRDGVTAQFASSVEFLGTANTASGNTRFGLGCFSDSKFNGDVSGVMGNTAGQVNCTSF